MKSYVICTPEILSMSSQSPNRLPACIISLAVFLYTGTTANSVLAQIVPDATLGGEASQLNTNVAVPGGVGDRISGGATRGISLFHSFAAFTLAAAAYNLVRLPKLMEAA